MKVRIFSYCFGFLTCVALGFLGARKALQQYGLW